MKKHVIIFYIMHIIFLYFIHKTRIVHVVLNIVFRVKEKVYVDT